MKKEKDSKRELSKAEVDDIIRTVQNSTDFKQYFGRSRLACCSYDVWQDGKRGNSLFKQRPWDIAGERQRLKEMRKKLKKRKGILGRGGKIGGVLAILTLLSTPANCVGGQCEREIDNLFNKARNLANTQDPSKKTLAYIGYFNAWREVGNRLGSDVDIPTGIAIQTICTQVAGGGP